MALNNDNLFLFISNNTETSNALIANKINRKVKELSQVQSEVIRFDCDITPISYIINEAVTIPFMATQKIIVLKNPIFLQDKGKTKDLELLNKYLNNSNPLTYILINASNIQINKDTTIYRTIMKKAEIIEFKEVSDVEIQGILVRKLASNNITINKDALLELLSFTNNNLLRAETECDKLLMFKYPQGNITIDDIERIVIKDPETDIYKLALAIEEKNKREVLEIYHDLKKGTTDELLIVSMLSKQYIDLYAVKSYLNEGFDITDIATITKMTKGRTYHLIEDSKKYKFEELRNYINSLADLDLNIKKGLIDKELGLELQLINMI